MPGPSPKNPKLRQRRNKDVKARTFKDKKSLKRIPDLPKRRRKWRVETIAWWRDIWKSPMSPEFIKSDIHQLYILADLIDQYWRESSTKKGPSTALATEVRLQRQCFGLTPIDRRRLEWEIEKAEGANVKGQKRRNEGRKLKNYKVDPRDVLEAKN
jgi:hypothetical protein